jgi:peptide/nickel transport system permease protein
VLAYFLKRIAISVAIIAVAILLLFGMIYVIPGDPISVALGPRASPEIVASFRARMGLDQPIYVQLLRFVGQILRGDLGTDVMTNRSVALTIMEVLPYTLGLIVGAMSWSILLGIPLGCFAAIRRNSLLDRITGVFSVATITVPSFVVAVYSLLAFAVWLGWFPVIGAGERGDLGDELWHLVLPSFAVGLGWVGYIARMVRASMLEVLSENHIRMARAFGLPERMITYRYALRLAILPTLTILGIGIGNLLSSAVFAEIVFARPGVGKLVYDAIIARNYPLVTGTILVTTAFYVLANLVTDLIVAGLDPRVRESLAR